MKEGNNLIWPHYMRYEMVGNCN